MCIYPVFTLTPSFYKWGSSFFPQHKPPYNPVTPKSFPSFPVPSPFHCFGAISRIWRVVTLFTTWCQELLLKVIECFQLIKNFKNPQPQTMPVNAIEANKRKPERLLNHQSQTAPANAMEAKKRKLKRLFNHRVDYKKFHTFVLSCVDSKKKELLYNNYNLQTYFSLKDHTTSLLDSPLEGYGKEIKASMAVHDAIVDLYLKRFLKKNPQMDNEKYLPVLRTIALIISIKVSWDEHIQNSNFIPFIHPYMGIKNHRKMEKTFLKDIDWNVSVSELFNKVNAEAEVTINET